MSVEYYLASTRDATRIMYYAINVLFNVTECNGNLGILPGFLHLWRLIPYLYLFRAVKT